MSSELEDTMTATSLTYLVAQEHINDLLREADRNRRAAEVRPSRRSTLAAPRRFARRVVGPRVRDRSVGNGTAFDLGRFTRAPGERDARPRSVDAPDAVVTIAP
jgi:hypothetical protein